MHEARRTRYPVDLMQMPVRWRPPQFTCTHAYPPQARARHKRKADTTCRVAVERGTTGVVKRVAPQPSACNKRQTNTTVLADDGKATHRSQDTLSMKLGRRLSSTIMPVQANQVGASTNAHARKQRTRTLPYSPPNPRQADGSDRMKRNGRANITGVCPQ